jgi:hypothetical protein
VIEDPKPTQDEDESTARGMAVSKLTAEDVGMPELADHEPAGPEPED